MLVLQDKITSLIERGAYNEAAQLFCDGYIKVITR